MMNSQKQALLEKIEEALNLVRPHLNVDGGDVEVVEVTDDLRLRIRWLGMCENCAMSTMTLRAGIAEAIKGKIPEITAVEAVNGVA